MEHDRLCVFLRPVVNQPFKHPYSIVQFDSRSDRTLARQVQVLVMP